MSVQWTEKEQIIIQSVTILYSRLFNLIMLVVLLNVAQCAQSASARTPEIRQAVQDASEEFNVDYDLIMAIIEVESSFNPNAIGGQGEIGLMQLLPRVHGDVSSDVRDNIRAGVEYLSYVRTVCSDRAPHSWFVFYNWGPFRRLKAPKQTQYYKKVTAALNRRRATLVAGGN